ncbi:MAG: hypothetical protein KUL88_15305 [Rhizobium sp.]|nr:hypothetical protein [Rhizobium sp.]
MIRYAEVTPKAPPPQKEHRSCRAVLIERMAADICEMQGSGEAGTEEALIARNWSRPVIEALLPDALATARRQFVRRG